LNKQKTNKHKRQTNINRLTTGGMPTFIDVSENFMSSEITEDNLISQFVLNGKKMAFMGDDTWESLYDRNEERKRKKKEKEKEFMFVCFVV